MALTILQQMIRDTARIHFLDNYSNKMVRLTEPQQPDSIVEIRGIPENALVLKVDTFPAPDTIFSGTNGECRRADYVIISDHNQKRRILFIEMKRNKGKANEITQQLKGATCVIAYCKEIAKHFYNCQDLFSGYEYRYVSLSHTSINKTGSRSIIRQKEKHDTPEKMLKISHPNNIQYNHLIGS